mmetsp:Transcript_149/g.399  ORF Transcript_149/g.399 Transcript_149/m.399 type:complete len:573 (-) Transcript_149:102-1820(-)
MQDGDADKFGDEDDSSEDITRLLTSLTGTSTSCTPAGSRRASAETILPQDVPPETIPEEGSGDADYDEKLRRWQQHRKAKKSSKEASYGNMLKNQAQEAPLDGSIEDLLRQRGLDVSGVEMLAQGSFAHVYKGSWTEPGRTESRMVAVKIMRGSAGATAGTNMPKWLQREIEVQQSQTHKHLVSVCKASLEREPCILLLEYCAGGSLQDLLQSVQKGGQKPQLWKLAWPQRLKIATDVAAGMLHLHSQRLIHRDLKPLNILLTHAVTSLTMEPHAKVGDFGMARAMEEQGKTNGVMTSTVGSWVYMAPEIMGGSGTYDEKVDVWSYAMVLYEILAEMVPFTNTNAKTANGVKLGLHLLRGLRPVTTTIPEDAPPCMVTLMGRCWATDPGQRPSFHDVHEELQSEYAKAPVGSTPAESPTSASDGDLAALKWMRISSCQAQPSLQTMMEEDAQDTSQYNSVSSMGDGVSESSRTSPTAGGAKLKKVPLWNKAIGEKSPEATIRLVSERLANSPAGAERPEPVLDKRPSTGCFAGCSDLFRKLVSSSKNGQVRTDQVGGLTMVQQVSGYQRSAR